MTGLLGGGVFGCGWWWGVLYAYLAFFSLRRDHFDRARSSRGLLSSLFPDPWRKYLFGLFMSLRMI